MSAPGPVRREARDTSLTEKRDHSGVVRPFAALHFPNSRTVRIVSLDSLG